MEFCFVDLYMGAFVCWLKFAWHWQHCTVRKYDSDWALIKIKRAK